MKLFSDHELFDWWLQHPISAIATIVLVAVSVLIAVIQWVTKGKKP